MKVIYAAQTGKRGIGFDSVQETFTLSRLVRERINKLEGKRKPLTEQEQADLPTLRMIEEICKQIR